MPSCGVQNLFRLVAPTNFDRCAILASLHHPPGALQRRCPARACLGKDYVLQKQKRHRKGVFLFWQGQKDLNPRHAVLETAALPTELYPYMVGLHGLEPWPDRL